MEKLYKFGTILSNIVPLPSFAKQESEWCPVCKGTGILGWIETEPESGITTMESCHCDMCGGSGKPPATKG